MAQRLVEQTAWTRALASAPDWALREELERRGEEPETDPRVRLPGLAVDPVAGYVLWRGVAYGLGGRQMEIVYALARAHLAGRRRLRSDVLAARIYPDWDGVSAGEGLWSHCRNLRRAVPGLLVSERLGGRLGGHRSYYRLALDDEQEAAG
jgi:hypothetical protein